MIMKEGKRMFLLTCESTTDLSVSYLANRQISALPYTYSVDNIEYVDDMGEFDGRTNFYKLLKQGKRPTTSQINTERYKNFFRQQLSQGDLLHVAFDSKLSGSVINAYYAAAEMRKEFPNRRIVVLDSACGCLGYGILVDMLADMRDNGASFDEIYDFARKTRTKIHHQFFSTTLSYYRRSGRISGPAASMGNILHLCPILHLDKSGKIIAYSKTMGVTKAIAKTLDEVATHVQDGASYNGRMWVAHSDCLDTAKKVVEKLKSAYANADVKLFDIGPVIGSHCGAGTVAVYFVGDERPA